MLVWHRAWKDNAMITVFDMFSEVPFEYLTISRGEVYGNRIISQKTLHGIVKIKEGMISQSNQEIRKSNSTVHVHPEDFKGMSCEQIIGNGIRYGGADYSIIGVTEGRNFDTNEVEHLTLTLERAEYVSDN